MIEKEDEDMLIASGLEFMRNITSVYGSEEGAKLWDTIAGAIDKDLKGKIFFAMMTGRTASTIKLPYNTVNSSIHNAVGVIKLFRQYDSRGLGLKEAKDIYDAMRDGHRVAEIHVDPKNRSHVVRELRKLGVVI